MYEGLSAAMSSAAAFIQHMLKFFKDYWGPAALNSTMRQLLEDAALCWNFSQLLEHPPKVEHLEAVVRLGNQVRPRMAVFKWPDAASRLLWQG